jgi:hypothetical protein
MCITRIVWNDGHLSDWVHINEDYVEWEEIFICLELGCHEQSLLTAA